MIVDVFHHIVKIVILKELVARRGGLEDNAKKPAWIAPFLKDRHEALRRNGELANIQQQCGMTQVICFSCCTGFFHVLYQQISASYLSNSTSSPPKLHGVGPFRRLLTQGPGPCRQDENPPCDGKLAVSNSDTSRCLSAWRCGKGGPRGCGNVIFLDRADPKNHIGNRVLAKNGVLYRLFAWIITRSSPFSTVQLAVWDRFWSNYYTESVLYVCNVM